MTERIHAAIVGLGVAFGMVMAGCQTSGERWADVAEEEADADPRLLSDRAAVPLVDAIGIAAREVPGRVVEAELEEEDGRVVYEVGVLSRAGVLHEVVVSAEDGAVVERSWANDRDDAMEAAGFRAVANATSRPLESFVASAVDLVPGRPVAAEFERDDVPVCEVEIVGDDGLLHELKFETATGMLLEQGLDDEVED